ncbi:MAG: hypothetical protein OES39_10170, partial [Desulfobulbaceae bacterium]|nr:hypothetical protein [Desulfobulbaceae bacterium]
VIELILVILGNFISNQDFCIRTFCQQQYPSQPEEKISGSIIWLNAGSMNPAASRPCLTAGLIFH